MARFPKLVATVLHHQKPWVVAAVCRERQTLPWTSDVVPDQDARAEMFNVCMSCPVLQDCATDTLKAMRSREILGGFYAGIWIPWPSNNADKAAELREYRFHVRRVLRSRAGNS